MTEGGSPTQRRRARLPDEVAAHVREQIMTGRVRQGEYLRLDLVAEELGISVTPVREALLTLRGEGFVELEPRQGFAVAPLSRQDLLDTYGIQAALAGELVSRTADKIGLDQLAELEALQAELTRVSRQQHPEVESLVRRFHHTINQVADAAKLTWFLGIVTRYAPRHFGSIVEGWAETCVTDHAVMLRALRAHDPTAADAAMREHITRVGQLLVDHLDKQGFWTDET